MSLPLTYRDAMNQLAELAQPSQPAHTRLQALTTLVRELSPANPHHDQVARALKPAPSPNPTFPQAPLTPEQQKQFHLHPLAADPGILPDDDDSAEEEDDPW